MKRLTLLLLTFTILGIEMRAQYFQHLYGTASGNELWDGANKVQHGQGYIMAGNTRNTGTGLNSLLVSSTDINGNVLAPPSFNQEYVIITSGEIPLEIDHPRIFEIPMGFGVIGRYTDLTLPSPNTGVFFLQLDVNGIPLNVFSYPIVSPMLNIIEIGYMDESNMGDFAYVCGAVSNSVTGSIHHFALKLDENTGTMMWGNVYGFQQPVFDARARDIIENPFDPDDVVIVGICIDNVSADGFLSHVNAVSGIPQFSDMVTTSSSNDFFQCIAGATNPNVNGFIVGGGTNVHGSIDYLVSLTDAAGNVIVSNAFDYSLSPGSFNYCNDVIERINPAGDYTYFATGGDLNGFFGGMDMINIKMDDQLDTVSGGEVSYGGAGSEWGGVFDMYNSGAGAPFDGLTTFGAWDAFGNREMYLVRSYFNEVSGCNEEFSTPLQQPGISMSSVSSPSVLGGFRSGYLNCWATSYSDVTLCFNDSLPTGSNALVRKDPVKRERNKILKAPDINHPIHPAYIAPHPASKISLQVYPNPVQDHFSLKCDQSIVTHIRIYNVMGQLIQEERNVPAKEIRVNSSNWSVGLYLVKVFAGDQLLRTEKIIKAE